MEKITITTEDGINLSALFWNNDAFASVLLLHMMPAQKESWVPLADELTALGMNVLAIDFRGHGESDGGNYKEFSSKEHQLYYRDVEAAMEYLKDSFSHTEVYIGGASIGANMAIKYMAEHHEIAKVFALSAGFDYHGVRAEDDILNLNEDQKILLAGSHDDVRGNEMSCGGMTEQLYERAEGVKEKIVYDTGGHGTDMFALHPELQDRIIKFITE